MVAHDRVYENEKVRPGVSGQIVPQEGNLPGRTQKAAVKPVEPGLEFLPVGKGGGEHVGQVPENRPAAGGEGRVGREEGGGEGAGPRAHRRQNREDNPKGTAAIARHIVNRNNPLHLASAPYFAPPIMAQYIDFCKGNW